MAIRRNQPASIQGKPPGIQPPLKLRDPRAGAAVTQGFPAQTGKVPTDGIPIETAAPAPPGPAAPGPARPGVGRAIGINNPPPAPAPTVPGPATPGQGRPIGLNTRSLTAQNAQAGAELRLPPNGPPLTGQPSYPVNARQTFMGRQAGGGIPPRPAPAPRGIGGPATQLQLPPPGPGQPAIPLGGPTPPPTGPQGSLPGPSARGQIGYTPPRQAIPMPGPAPAPPGPQGALPGPGQPTQIGYTPSKPATPLPGPQPAPRVPQAPPNAAGAVESTAGTQLAVPQNRGWQFSDGATQSVGTTPAAGPRLGLPSPPPIDTTATVIPQAGPRATPTPPPGATGAGRVDVTGQPNFQVGSRNGVRPPTDPNFSTVRPQGQLGGTVQQPTSPFANRGPATQVAGSRTTTQQPNASNMRPPTGAPTATQHVGNAARGAVGAVTNTARAAGSGASALNRGAGRAISGAPGAIRNFGPMAALGAMSNPQGAIDLIKNPSRLVTEPFNAGATAAEMFLDGRARTGLDGLLTGGLENAGNFASQLAHNTPGVGQILGAGENLGKTALDFATDPSGAWGRAKLGAQHIAGSFTGNLPQPAAPQAAPSHLSEANLSQVTGAGGNPSAYVQDANGNLMAAHPGQTPATPAQAAVPQSAADMNRQFNAQGIGPGEKAVAAQEAASQAPAKAAAPAPTVPGGAPQPQAPQGDKLRQALLGQLARAQNDQRYGYINEDVAGKQQRVLAAVAAIHAHDANAAGITESGAKAKLLNEQARPDAQKMGDLRDPVAFHNLLVSKGAKPEDIPALMAGHRAAMAQGQGGGQAPAQFDQSNYQQELMTNPAYDSIRGVLTPGAGGAANPMESILDAVSKFPGATSDPRVQSLIRQGILAQYRDPQKLQEARSSMMPGIWNMIGMGNPHNAGRLNLGAQLGLWQAN